MQNINERQTIKRSEIICPVCCSSDTQQIYCRTGKQMSRLCENKPCRLTLFKCRRCGMLFLGEINYDLQQIHELYWDMLTKSIAKSYSVDIAKSKNLLFNELGKYRKTGNLLEIGCGDGTFLKFAQERGWKVKGVEISAQAAALARQKFGFDILNGSLEQTCRQLEKNSFDIVVMWGVIEHLQNPVTALKLAKSLLRKGGILLIYTPNADSIFHKLARATYLLTCKLVKFPMELVIIAMHTMYITPRTLSKALDSCNFLIQKIQMTDIDMDFIFKTHNECWWSNKLFLICVKFLQSLSHLSSSHSHMIVLAESA